LVFVEEEEEQARSDVNTPRCNAILKCIVSIVVIVKNTPVFSIIYC
jgi:hypothetical protein